MCVSGSKEHFLEHLIGLIDTYKVWILIGFSCLLGLSAYTALKTLSIDNGLGLWFLDDNPSYKSYIDYQETYGSDEIIIVMIPSENPLNPQVLERLEKLSQILEQKPYVKSSMSVLRANYPALIGNEIQLKPIYDAKRPLKSQQKLLSQFPALKKQLLGAAGENLFLYLQLNPTPAIEKQRKQMVKEIRKEVKQSFEGAYISGPPILNDAYNQGIFKESFSFGLLSILAISLMLWWLLPQKKYILIVLASVGVPMGLLFGGVAALGFSLNMISMLIPTILLVYTVCDAVHIINIFHRLGQQNPDLDRKELLKKSFQKSFIPCLLTTLTTVLSYLALYISPLPAFKTMGLVTVMGLLLSFVLVYVLIALGVLVVKIEVNTNKSKRRYLIDTQGWMLFVDRTTDLHKNKIIIASLLLFVIGLCAIPYISVDTDSKDLLAQGQVKEELSLIETQIGGSSRLQLNITNANSFLNKSSFQKLNNFQESLENNSQIGTVFSLVNLQRFLLLRYPILAKTHLEGNLSKEGLGTLVSAQDFFPWGSEDGRTMTLTLSFKQMTTTELEGLITAIEKTFQSHFNNKQASLEINGFAAVYTQLNQFILKSQQNSFLLAIFGSFICLLLFIKNIKTSLLILLPNLLPLSILAISMVVLDIPLGVTTAMITPIMLGIVMDDSIHLLYHYKIRKNRLLSAKERISKSLHYNGKALFTATLSLVAGFLVIATSAVPSVVDFGILCAITVASALISDLFFLTAVLKKFDNKM